MQFEQIRNATVILDFAGKKFLVDPWLAPQGSNGTFKELGMEKEAICAGHNKFAMPICALPKLVAEILNGVDYYIITHIHPDHIDIYSDGTVGKDLNHNTPIFVQSKGDGEILKKSGFTDVRVMMDNTQIGEITLIKTPALHGTKVPCGEASGFILKHKDEKSVYVAGDTIFYDEVKNTLQQYRPEVIILNACAATFNTFGRLIMDDGDVASVYEVCPNAKIIASHMDNVAHATLTRKTLREKLQQRGLSDKILVPNDGEIYRF
ncbi:MAG: MBL fold metallo-hydrolase [Alphaproteobacteria bacterium]|nr:MBL fold metallo-hydrolase [Alphaproteobacteria bacterium]